ncbi:SDR family oxidoreductase [Nocardioides lentus]|uniref:SDR family oxidoreductase n=1 Tax=Nocardioides lentus TaxID=338077 RepID=A0ABN2PKU4_9ACTN
MSGRLDGVRVVVTGASSGIGEATARALATEGATVALLARRTDMLEEIAADIATTGGDARAYQVDVTDAAAVRDTVNSVAADLGAIDVLVNNAGVGSMSLAVDADLDEWHTMVDVNLHGVLHSSHAALPHLVEAAKGARGVADLITVSSASGRRVPKPTSNVYAATKHAVGAFCEALRQELGPQHVRVGLVEPGFVVTDMTSGRDFGELEALEASDVADTIVFMLTRPRRHGINEVLMRAIGQDS